MACDRVAFRTALLLLVATCVAYNVAHLIYAARNARAIITSVSSTPGPTGVWQFSAKDGGWVMEVEPSRKSWVMPDGPGGSPPA